MNLQNEITQQAILRLEESTIRIEKCLEELSEEEVWLKPNASLNSVGNLILHLCGNITQYIISSIGKVEDGRKRDLEFSTEGGFDKLELLTKLKKTVEQAAEVINALDMDDLLEKRSVQGFEYSGIGNIIHVVEHYSYHTGQIAFWTKLLKDKALGFYAGIDLNIKNAPPDKAN
jgi:uncharacterized damage-inducible protein DinB